ncbi:hypothetical protein QBC35DRAFT_454125 [Podospora australis]|uniref:Uncharacterized protein n=1 Tax=Podospora australis TaxID=1536484 RepID=A0AAN6WSP2_9PEZI|nr:hypothetical protein QBC35DRAFT_454125 [Podospora australis]
MAHYQPDISSLRGRRYLSFPPPHRNSGADTGDLQEISSFVARHLVPAISDHSDRPIKLVLNFGHLIDTRDDGTFRRPANDDSNTIIYNAPGATVSLRDPSHCEPAYGCGTASHLCRYCRGSGLAEYRFERIPPPPPPPPPLEPPLPVGRLEPLPRRVRIRTPPPPPPPPRPIPLESHRIRRAESPDTYYDNDYPEVEDDHLDTRRIGLGNHRRERSPSPVITCDGRERSRSRSRSRSRESRSRSYAHSHSRSPSPPPLPLRRPESSLKGPSHTHGGIRRRRYDPSSHEDYFFDHAQLKLTGCKICSTIQQVDGDGYCDACRYEIAVPREILGPTAHGPDFVQIASEAQRSKMRSDRIKALRNRHFKEIERERRRIEERQRQREEENTRPRRTAAEVLEGYSSRDRERSRRQEQQQQRCGLDHDEYAEDCNDADFEVRWPRRRSRKGFREQDEEV